MTTPIIVTSRRHAFDLTIQKLKDIMSGKLQFSALRYFAGADTYTEHPCAFCLQIIYIEHNSCYECPVYNVCFNGPQYDRVWYIKDLTFRRKAIKYLQTRRGRLIKQGGI